ncbi:virulence-associated ABC transporter ATP-binding protein SfbB [Lelliottia sp. V89_10]|jgi:D-methionine transport system ATP-binding protein|uniref:virulence-associated ABC transporter ATP-binding protein SfbB n=1 Tax=Lelliottia wanjuensis TaxID=3050585 RepID=UPI00249E3912|nr:MULTISPECIES: virulence-associated ABC transporter ATP-binding protein SfbB [unclassified Lelliottia]MDI3359861.1 virulence-associated ABC transporter ATP-binding protein SfbB [Lelliottia sp. V89_13]MDK9548087.1 virulence-associated ABC transporter ATP-binding protein SfbB [Lelliottia sp. V89_5]MDK9595073.1 virulence-associated ABC transporter ATP-binding protein SfbB [Lelliottia sp. V89_10]MDK9603306.1 virulence-associated ABC transporter ATP-binding protein SfbB [Lelliottia sp. V104_15]
MIELDKVCVDFQTGRGPSTRAVSDVSLTIAAGEIFGIVGTSGAGKSTLLRTLNALQRPSAGRVNVNGVEISALDGVDLRKARQRIGMIFQHFNLMHTRTVAQNVAFSLKAAGWERSKIAPRVTEILALVGLTDKANRYPVQLSGGQKQRVGIARAIANHPDVLLCDEPTSALDLETSATILALLKKINQQMGITIVLITHEMNVIKSICDRVAVMSGGEVVELGEVFDVFAHPQHPFTQQLVSHTLNLTLPERLQQHLPGQLLKILFIGDSAEQPVLSDVAIKFGVAVNILHGKIEYIGERALGILVVQLTADDPAVVETAVEHIRHRTAQVEVIRG